MTNNKPTRRITLKDIATHLGVSVATVSRALKNSKEIGPDLCRRVHALADEWNYRPNPFAQSLRKGTPSIIGVIVPNIVTHFHSGVIAGIEDRARRAGYSVICANSREQYAVEVALCEELASLHVEGIIASIAQDTTDYAHFERLHSMNVPVVFFARTCLSEKFSSVVSNGERASYEGTSHLVGKGCRRIAFIGGPNHLDMVQRRKHGYLEALRENGITIDRELVRCKELTHEAAYQSMQELLDMPTPPDGVLAVNNTLIYGAMKAIKDRRLRMPDDIRLIGFSDDYNLSYLSPTVSAIEDQAHLMGEQTCNLLLQRIGGDSTVQHKVVPMRLVYRESSR